MDRYRFIASGLRFKARLPLLCIAVSFVVMIIAIAVSAGFRREIRNGISEISGDIQVLPINSELEGELSYMPSEPSFLKLLEEHKAVEKVVPVIYRAGIIKEGEDIHGVMFKAVPNADSSLTVSVPRRLADMLEIAESDKLLAYFVGEKLRLRNFRVNDIYEPLISGDDKLIVRCKLEDMQRLNGWDSNQVSALEIFVKDEYKSDAAIKELESELAFLIYANSSSDEVSVHLKSSVSAYPQLYDWLNLIDFNVLVILLLMTLVAAFNMISGLLIILFENTSAIGLLKSLGMTNRGIVRVFLTRSASFVSKGMLIGNVIAILICVLIDAFHLIPLDPVNYFVDHVPASLNFVFIFLADIAAFLAIMLVLLLPSLFISRVDPAQTLRVK